MTKEQDELWTDLWNEYEMKRMELEAKLAIAVEALEKVLNSEPNHFMECENAENLIVATKKALAQIKEGD